ncbi:MAG: polyprenol monophosphomannose synthase [Sulfolobales archaeon]
MGKEIFVRLAVIIPTYNEAENIPMIFERCFSSLAGLDFELVVVDDNSPDGTADVAERLGAAYGNVKVIRRPSKAGLASAVLDGIRATNAEVVAVIDADLQHPPELLPIMYSMIIRGYDVVIASRYVVKGCIEDWSFTREIMSRIAIAIAHLLFPKTRKVKDINSGYFMVKRNLINDIKIIPISFKILLAILVSINNYNKVLEIPYIFSKRKHGVSKLNFSEIIKYLVDITRLLIYNTKHK